MNINTCLKVPLVGKWLAMSTRSRTLKRVSLTLHEAGPKPSSNQVRKSDWKRALAPLDQTFAVMQPR